MRSCLLLTQSEHQPLEFPRELRVLQQMTLSGHRRYSCHFGAFPRFALNGFCYTVPSRVTLNVTLAMKFGPSTAHVRFRG